MADYVTNGFLETDKREIAIEENWDTQEDWESYTEKNNVEINNGVLSLTELEILTIDDFEWGGPVSDRYGGQGTGDFEINTNTPVYDGNYSLKNTSNNTDIGSMPGDGLDNYPEQGDIFECWVYVGSNSNPGVTFGHSELRSDTYSDMYLVQLNAPDYADPELTIGYYSSGNGTVLSTSDEFIQSDTWYKVEIAWHSNNNIEATAYDINNNEEGGTSVNDDTYTNTSGFGVWETGSSGATAVWDNAIITGRDVL